MRDHKVLKKFCVSDKIIFKNRVGRFGGGIINLQEFKTYYFAASVMTPLNNELVVAMAMLFNFFYEI